MHLVHILIILHISVPKPSQPRSRLYNRQSSSNPPVPSRQWLADGCPTPVDISSHRWKVKMYNIGTHSKGVCEHPRTGLNVYDKIKYFSPAEIWTPVPVAQSMYRVGCGPPVWYAYFSCCQTTLTFRHFPKIAKRDCWLRHVCPYEKTRLPLDGFSWNEIFENF
jgi:hypothetical protein